MQIFDAPRQLITHCLGPQRVSDPISKPGLLDAAQVANLIRWLTDQNEFEQHDAWVKLGMACRAEYGAAGIDLWRLAHDDTVTDAVETAKWRSFAEDARPGAVTLATWLRRAHELGWSGTIQKSAAAMFADVLHVPSPSIAPQASGTTRLIKTSAEFIAGYVPPDYLIDGLLQRRYIYSVTAKTGAGKTSIALRMVGHVVTGLALGEREVERGTVLYFAGENPDDVRARWFVLCREMNIDPSTDMVQWVDGAMDLTQVAECISREIAENGNEYALVVVDTAAAYFPGDDENSNTQAGNHARHLRSMTTLPGGPCTLVLCHPTKRAADDDLQPRGGGAFIAEMDGNIAVAKKEMLVTAAPFGKFRGDNSWSIKFELDVIKDHPTLKDAKGRFTTSVLARPVAEGAAAVIETRADSDTIAVLNAVCSAPGCTPTDIARSLGWTFGSKADPNVNRVKRNLKRLADDKAVKETLGRWKATSTGQQALNDADRAKAVQPRPMFPMPPIPQR